MSGSPIQFSSLWFLLVRCSLEQFLHMLGKDFYVYQIIKMFLRFVFPIDGRIIFTFTACHSPSGKLTCFLSFLLPCSRHVRGTRWFVLRPVFLFFLNRLDLNLQKIHEDAPFCMGLFYEVPSSCCIHGRPSSGRLLNCSYYCK